MANRQHIQLESCWHCVPRCMNEPSARRQHCKACTKIDASTHCKQQSLQSQQEPQRSLRRTPALRCCHRRAGRRSGRLGTAQWCHRWHGGRSGQLQGQHRTSGRFRARLAPAGTLARHPANCTSARQLPELAAVRQVCSPQAATRPSRLPAADVLPNGASGHSEQVRPVWWVAPVMLAGGMPSPAVALLR
jgi:hypothetical protein